ncbi:hypothetical protein GCM10023096_70350 [Nonomuraea ferruginea]
MYTFMPPASPVPGWSSGDVCMLIVATRLTRRRLTRHHLQVTYNCPDFFDIPDKASQWGSPKGGLAGCGA